jgi:hypothetical protein
VELIHIHDRTDIAKRRPQIGNLLREIQFNHVAC